MTPRAEFFAALTAASSDQAILTAISLILCLGVFTAAILRAVIMRKASAAAAASLPLDLNEEEHS